MSKQPTEPVTQRVAGTLISLNVGMPRERNFPGGAIASAIDKRPVGTRRMVRTLNVDGDAQGDLRGHGGEQRAVLVYDASNYDHWAKRFDRLRGLAFGGFGENFTVTGLTDNVVCIGDRYAIGSALFEVTQPRVTCFRLGAHTGVRDLPRAFVDDGRPGFYMRVLVEGEVGPCDQITLVERGRHGLTVSAVDRLLYGAERPRALLAKALDIPALSPGWRASLADLLDGRSADAAGRPPVNLAWQGWRRFVVGKKTAESAVDMSLHIRPGDGGPLPPFEAGQFISVRLPELAPGGRRIIRSWSLSAPAGPEGWRITVRRASSPGGPIAAGVASAAVHDVLRCGDEIEVAAPRGEFTLAAVPADASLAFVTAGVGITPAMAMLEDLLRRSPSLARDVWFLHAARNENELAFAARLEALRSVDPLLRIGIWLSRPLEPQRLAQSFALGRISVDVLRELALPADTHWFICGPKTFQRELISGLRAGGVDTLRLHLESFGDRSAPPQTSAGAALVTFARSGGAANWDGGRFESLLDLVEDAGVRVNWSCRAGVCHLCQTAVLDGQVTYAVAPPDPPRPGAALLCCSVPSGDLVLDC